MLTDTVLNLYTFLRLHLLMVIDQWYFFVLKGKWIERKNCLLFSLHPMMQHFGPYDLLGSFLRSCLKGHSTSISHCFRGVFFAASDDATFCGHHLLGTFLRRFLKRHSTRFYISFLVAPDGAAFSSHHLLGSCLSRFLKGHSVRLNNICFLFFWVALDGAAFCGHHLLGFCLRRFLKGHSTRF
jgi:hypothetical protein